MTKKDYIAIAGVIRDTVTTPSQEIHDETLYALIGGLCKVFANDNPRFDQDRFVAACLENRQGDK